MPDEYYFKKTTQLTSDEQTDIQCLLEASARFDGCPYDCFTENELCCLDNFPCFYQLYSHDNHLICFISLFFDKTDLFIYGITHPHHRYRRCFSRLLFFVFQYLNKYHASIKNIYYPVNAKMQNSILNHYIQSNRISYDYSEYLMKKKLDSSIPFPYPDHLISCLPELEYEETQASCEYSLWVKDLYVGGCLIEYITKTEAMIYQFGIVDEEQGKGYGKSGLILICRDLKDRQYSAVSLQVTGRNKKAHRLYTDCGFEIMDEIQYFIHNKL